MRRLAAVYVNDGRDREDLVQEIAVALWQAIPKFRGEASERTWLYRIAHNTAITASAKLWRRGRRKRHWRICRSCGMGERIRDQERMRCRRWRQETSTVMSG